MRARWYVYIIVCFFFLLTSTFLGAAVSTPQDNITNNARRSSTKRRRTAVSKKGRRARLKAKSHCQDKEPSGAAANNCNLGVNKPFIVNCSLPFNGGASRDIDQHCPNQGCTQSLPDITQNLIKSNLCATGTPVRISFNSIDRLQQDVDQMVAHHQITYGRRATPKKASTSSGPPQPKDRPKIGSGKLSTVDKDGHSIKIGEGDIVTLEAFVLDAKHDDTFPFGFGGETVNCKNSLLEWNDIHIALGQTAQAKECDSVTAEIIPHFRPPVWERFDSNSCTAQHVTNPLPVKGLRVRITGQLFFDGSHLPSTCSKPAPGGNPLRRAVWEIHPVYKIEVFDTSSSQFISLEDWAARQH
jgi:hypothetical protein